MINRITSNQVTAALHNPRGYPVKQLRAPNRVSHAVGAPTLNERTPIYMGLITLSSALAAVTQLWAGVVTFGLVVLVFEGLNRCISRLSR